MGDRTVDLDRLELHGPDGVHTITKREAELLRYLAERRGETVSQRELLTEVWSYAPQVESRAAYHTVARLRQRLEPDPTHPRFLVTVRGQGFRLEQAREVRRPEGMPSASTDDLPRRRTVFFDREHERSDVLARIRQTPSPVVSILGLGGIGKSRLALELCHELVDDFDHVIFCDVTEAVSRETLVATLGRTLRVPLPGERIGLDTLVRHLADRGPTLLALDNIEQAVDDVADVALQIIDRCPAVSLLVTGRRGLDLRGECQIVLDVLPPPPDDADLGALRSNHAVRMFLDRIALKEPFELTEAKVAAVRAVVRHLEGWPLALELAAAQVPVVGLDWLEQQAGDVRELRMPHRDSPSRHRTVDDTLQWTWGLLDPVQRSVWTQLSWFRGGFSVEAAAEVVACPEPLPGVLTALRERGLVRRIGAAPGMRYGMLASVRAFARDRLEDPEPVALRHMGWARGLHAAMASIQDIDRVTALITADFENLELAWETAEARGDGDALADIALGMTRSAWWYGSHGPMIDRLLAALERSPDRAMLWHQAGCFATRTRPLSEAARYLREALEVGQRTGARAEHLAIFRQHLALVLARQDDHDAADALFEQAHRASPPGSRIELAVLSNWCVSLAARAEPRSVTTGERALRLCREHEDELTETIVLHNLAKAYLALGRRPEALEALDRALELARRHRSADEALVLCQLGVAWEGDVDRSLGFLLAAARAADRDGDLRILVEVHARLARLWATLDQLPDACRALETAERFASLATAPVERLIREAADAIRGR